MTEQLTNDKQVSKMFLQALRDFSEACEPPLLTPSCPFSVEISPGQRGCGEECMDILGRYNAPLPSEEMQLENGLTVRRVRRPRPRHTATRQIPAFDARGLYLDESSRSQPSQWALSSLLYRLKDLAGSAPSTIDYETSERRSEIAEIIRLLEARGLKFESYLEPSLRKHVGYSVWTVVVAALKGSETNDEVAQEWKKVVVSCLEKQRSGEKEIDGQRLLMEVFAIVRAWADVAPVLEVLAWKIPADLSPRALANSIAEKSESENYDDSETGGWLFDRFTETYIDRWSPESMRREWMYIHGQLAPPCSPFELRAREVKEVELSPIMADYMVKLERTRQKPNKAYSTAIMTRHLISPAATFLRQGRRTEAGALFEAILQGDPEDADANNNLGFCLIPDNPELALRYFDAATAKRSHQTELVAVNRMLALAKLGRNTPLIDIAASMFGISQADSSSEKYECAEGAGTYLWDVDSVLFGSDPQLDETSDFSAYARYIVSKVSTTSS